MAGQPADAELVGRLTGADEEAFVELYQRFGRLCYSLAHRICSDDGLAEDVVHEVFLTLWRDPSRFDPAQESFPTWLLTLVHHRAVDVVRRSTKAHRRTVTRCETDVQSVPGARAGRAVLPRATAGQVRAALDRLPGEQRQVLAGAYFGGHTLREIAAFTGVPLETVKSRMLAGVRQLRSLAERLGPDAPAVLAAEARAVREVGR